MLRQLLSTIVIVLSFMLVATPTFAINLPDFTVLAEKQGPAVVNISITQVTWSR